MISRVIVLLAAICFGMSGTYAQSESPDSVHATPAIYLTKSDGGGTYIGRDVFWKSQNTTNYHRIMFTSAIMPEQVVYGRDKIYFFFEKNQIMTISPVATYSTTDLPLGIYEIEWEEIYYLDSELLREYKPMVFTFPDGNNEYITSEKFREMLAPLRNVIDEAFEISPAGKVLPRIYEDGWFYQGENFWIIKDNYIFRFYNIDGGSTRKFINLVDSFQFFVK